MFSDTNRFLIDTLIPFTNYTFTSAAQTSVGTGPYSTLLAARTSEAGKPILHYELHGYCKLQVGIFLIIGLAVHLVIKSAITALVYLL